nr:hypothetical protein B0A51_15435 [Rachicladosporium sp. CCFEE 5018]
MGNSESKEKDKDHRTAATGSPAVARHARKKESAHSLSSASASHASSSNTPPPLPTSSLISTTTSASHTTQHSRAHATAIPTISPASSHNLQSTTAAYSTRPLTPGDGNATLTPNDSAISQLQDSQHTMGSSQSKDAAHGRPTTLPTTATSPRPSSTDPAIAEVQSPDFPSDSPSAHPVDVPSVPTFRRTSLDNTYPAPDPNSIGSPYGLPPSDFSRPPRLPLPIDEEGHVPGSPIISPQDLVSPVEGELEGLPRRTSVLSANTVDDEDALDNEAYTTAEAVDVPKVPTKVEWRGPGDKIFVTGTFVSWERKFKLTRSKEKPGVFSAVIGLKPGTHHIKFLVDGDMMTSNDMPTTVDFTNILVNYIEVVAPLPGDSAPPSATAEKQPLPGTAAAVGQSPGTADNVKPLDIRTVARPSDSAKHTTDKQPSAAIPISGTAAHSTSSVKSSRSASKGVPLPKAIIPPATYTQAIPQFLVDLDTYNDRKSEGYRRCDSVVKTLPQPPSLPGFLGKSILNGTTPHKDDASVLIMPNHTVLNHLATSSIKSGVLATSGTTRYKRKVSTGLVLEIK